MKNDDNSPTTDSKSLFEKIRDWARSIGFGGGGESSLRESLEEVIEEHEEDLPSEKHLGDDERSMLINVLNYGDLRLDDIMIPRVDIVSVNIGIGFSELIEAFSEASHSRLPIYKKTLDEIVGMIHVKDLVINFSETKKNDWQLEPMIRPVLFVAPSMRPMDLLAKMRAGRTHMAIVVDEYGGTDGLVTIEDLIEQIVGDIEDEHDDEENLTLVLIEEGVFEANARLEIEDLEAELGVDFLADKEDEDIDTLGGLVISLVGRVPQIGDNIFHPLGFKFEILDADPRKLKKIRIYTLGKESEVPSNDE